MAEKFLHTLKVELIHGKTYNTRKEAKTTIFEYIERFDNQQRLQSYLCPDEYEKKNLT
jgi:putative transposase